MRKIAVVTGSRAEFGILKPLILALMKDKALELQVFVTGMHLSSLYGNTVQEIEDAGIPITAKVESLEKGNDHLAMARSVAKGFTGFNKVFAEHKPDLVIVLGDRYEILAAANAAFFARIPIAHLHGGELTSGAIDDSIRHVLTKLSSLHFVSHKDYQKRVIQMGEEPSSVHNVGALSIENARNLALLSKKTLSEDLGLRFGKKNILCTYHPTTQQSEKDIPYVKAMLTAFEKMPEAHVFFTMPNSDPGSQEISKLLEVFVQRNSKRCFIFKSLGVLRYLSLVSHVDLVVGNSSSGVLEVPALGVPTVDIGSRQDGRIRPPSVIHVDKTTGPAMQQAFKKALSAELRKKAQKHTDAFGDGKSSIKILKILKTLNYPKLLNKKFYDLK